MPSSSPSSFSNGAPTDELGLPESLQGIIAARLDGLADTEKDLLRNAAVVGKVFWAAAVRNGSSDAPATLHSLERKGFVRRQKRSSVEGETEFAFAHALVRDVAYGQIARADRAEKHRRVAEWIEALGRPDDHAEMVAHHWQAAFELARAAGVEATDLAERLGWPCAKPATARPHSTRIRPRRSTTQRHSISGRIRIRTGPIFCSVARERFISQATTGVPTLSPRHATRSSAPMRSSRQPRRRRSSRT